MDARASRLLLPLSLVGALSLPHPRLPQLRSRPARLPWEQTSKPWLRNQCWHLPGTPNSCEVVSSNPFILVCKGMAVRGEKPWHSLIDEELKTTVNILEAHNFYYLLGMSRRNSSTRNEWSSKANWSVAQSCPTLCNPMNWAPLSMGFSRQEYWSGLPFPSQPREGTCVSCIADGFFTTFSCLFSYGVLF